MEIARNNDDGMINRQARNRSFKKMSGPLFHLWKIFIRRCFIFFRDSRQPCKPIGCRPSSLTFARNPWRWGRVDIRPLNKRTVFLFFPFKTPLYSRWRLSIFLLLLIVSHHVLFCCFPTFRWVQTVSSLKNILVSDREAQRLVACCSTE